MASSIVFWVHMVKNVEILVKCNTDWNKKFKDMELTMFSSLFEVIWENEYRSYIFLVGVQNTVIFGKINSIIGIIIKISL